MQKESVIAIDYGRVSGKKQVKEGDDQEAVANQKGRYRS